MLYASRRKSAYALMMRGRRRRFAAFSARARCGREFRSAQEIDIQRAGPELRFFL